uniref:Putative transmembrane and coiled-coil domain-containing proteinconserved plasma membrane protein n=1 Tax=Ixodes ricinus TaxID=34613 RepID=A0A147BQR7_IXORI
MADEIGLEAEEAFQSPAQVPHRIGRPVQKFLGDAGLYSYCAICALSLHDLFPDEWDRDFSEKCLSQIICHLSLPGQVRPVMQALMSGEGGELEPFIHVLKEEPGLNGNCLRVVEDLVLFAVQGGIYDARTRVFIFYVALRLRVSRALVEMYEESVVEMLSQEVHEQTEEERKEIAKRQRNKKLKRFLMIGLATVGGGAVIGLTGGLAAPLMAAGAGAIIGGAGAAALGSATGIAVIGSLIGIAGAGLTGYKMKKRVGEIEEFAFDTLTEGRGLHVTLAVSGWLSDDEPGALKKPWRTLQNSREQYCLRYESSYLLELGHAIDYLFSFAVSMAAQEALKYTILSGLIAAITWPATLVMVAGVIDNPWGVCIRRSAEVGRHLAEILLARQQGKRPVTLVGFSLGARVIFYCLKEMAKRKGCEGIIEDAVLLGAPVPAHKEEWKPMARVVSGRIVNGYCRGDWLLKFLHRTSSATLKIAGLQAIRWNNRRMFNVDLSDVVSGHTDYVKKMDIILKAVGIQTCDDVFDMDSNMRKSKSYAPERGDSMPGCQLHRSKSDSVLVSRKMVSLANPLGSHLRNTERPLSYSLESVLSRSSSAFGSSAATDAHHWSPRGFLRSTRNLLKPRGGGGGGTFDDDATSGVGSTVDSWEWNTWEEEAAADASPHSHGRPQT